MSNPKDRAETQSVEKEEMPEQLSKQILNIVQDLASTMGELRTRIEKVEGVQKEEKQILEDKAEISPETPKGIVKVVHDVLGEEYGVEVEALDDKPGYMLHIIVPSKYSQLKNTASLTEIKRKKELEELLKAEDLTKEKKKLLYEELFSINGKIQGEDRRSCYVGNHEGTTKVKEWATKVRVNLQRNFIREGKSIS